jgi:dipeptidyl aminopeptidase/acylaminoacyl peptidase
VSAEQPKPRKFTVADDIGLTHLVWGTTESAIFSPDDEYFFVLSERGRLDLNRSESSIRVYSSEEVRRFFSQTNSNGEPLPIWVFTKSTYKDGPIITSVRWLPDSSGLALLAKTSSGNDQLCLADIRTKTLHTLTPQNEHVTAFDIRSRRRFIYSVLSPTIREKAAVDSEASAIVGTGRSLESLIFPNYSAIPNVWLHDISDLWAVLDGRRFRIVDPLSGQPIHIHLEGQRALALSPDGRALVTALTVRSIPAEWETLYPPPLSSTAYRIRAGRQDPDALNGQRDVSEYVLIGLCNHKIKSLTSAPIGNAAGWWGFSHADWSADSKFVVLPNTFLPPNVQAITEQGNQPCVAVIDLSTGRRSCLEHAKQNDRTGKVDGWQRIFNVGFAHGNNQVVRIEYSGIDGSVESRTFTHRTDGSWSDNTTHDESGEKNRPVAISVRQGLNSPPVLIATEGKSKRVRVVWDPNPQLKNIELAEVSVLKWQDRTGRDWIGGLYKPFNYVPGKRYPLVIQTHGFDERRFQPSGAFTSAFAAQELAAVGFLVLQVADCPIRVTPEEGACQVAGYESAVARLSSDGLVDSNRIGIIGFSRTCYYVLEALTTSSLQFKAASITDGVNEGYLQYILNLDLESHNAIAHEAEAMIGASPFGAGLHEWLRRSPVFNMDKVNAPLQVVMTTPECLLMWEPYATLRYQSKPVDLLVLHSDEHIFTNPIIRMISQGGTVDWFSFWLLDYEDPAPAKSEQYRRWEAMRPIREATTNVKPG